MQQTVEYFDYSTILHLITGGCVGKDCFVAYMVALTWPLVCLASATIVAFDGAVMHSRLGPLNVYLIMTSRGSLVT